MKWLAALLALAAVALSCWLAASSTGSPAALQPLEGLQSEGIGSGEGLLPGSGPIGSAEITPRGHQAAARTDIESRPNRTGENAAPADDSVRFAVRVVEANGAPILDGRLWIPSLPEVPESSARSRGETILTLPRDLLSSNPLEFRVDAPGYATKAFMRTWEGSGEEYLGEFPLSRGSRLAGRVLDPSGSPVPNALVCAAEMTRVLLTTDRLHHELRGPTRGPRNYFGRLGRERAEDLSPEMRTDASGRFAFEAIPGSWSRVWARSEESRWTWTENIALDPNQARSDVELTLEVASAEDWIRGVVLDPSGRPVVGQIVEHLLPDDNYRGLVTSDARGRFRVGITRPGLRDLRASPKVWEWDPAEALNVAPGAADIVLQFHESEWVWARVTNLAGEPITKGRVTGLRTARALGGDETAEVQLPRVVSDLWDDGRARLHLPKEDFDLKVEAEGYEPKRVGPFPRRTPEIIEIALEPLRGLGVRVMSSGVPVADALVQLHASAPKDEEFYYDERAWGGHPGGFARDLAPRSRLSAETDSAGRAVFALPSGKDDSPWTLVAGADGRASGYSDSVRLADFSEEREIEIELPRSGSLRGELSLPADEDGRGWTIFVCDGVGILRDAPVDDESAFYFAHLHPGPWQVRAMPPGRVLARIAHTRKREPRTFDVEIRATEEANLVLAPLRRPRARLRGQLTFEGHELGAWHGSITSASIHFELDADGAFEVDNLEPGEWTIALASADERWSHLLLREPITLVEGQNWWEGEFAFGTITGTYHPWMFHDIPIPLFAKAETETLRLQIRLTPDDEDRIAPLLVPVGTYLIVPTQGMLEAAGNTDPRPELEIEVLAGETVEIEIDGR